MDPQSFNLYREKIGESLTKRLNDAYLHGIISEDESPIIAQFILDNIDKPTTHQELITLLEELANKWPVFGPILVMERAASGEEKTDEAVEQIQQLIKEDRIDEAIAAAGEATSASDKLATGGSQ